MEPSRNRAAPRTGLLAALALFAGDQLSKWWMLDVVDIAGRQHIEITGFFNLVMVWNRGVSFGLFSDQDMRWGLVAFALIVCAVLCSMLWRAACRFQALCFGLIIGGALGNVVDRLRFGAVVDFLDFHALGAHWPAFNVADAAICIGVALLVGQSMLKPHPPTTDPVP